jgi:hypothetical protein
MPFFERVMANLMENAAKFAGPEAHIAVAAINRGTWAEVSVYDDGPGIPAGNEQYLFERFSRCDFATGKPLALWRGRFHVFTANGISCSAPSLSWRRRLTIVPCRSIIDCDWLKPSRKRSLTIRF